jgi:hypothetical protein
MKAKRTSSRTVEKTKQIIPRTVEEIVDVLVARHSRFVDLIRRDHPDLSRKEVDFLAVKKLASLRGYRGDEDLLLVELNRVLLGAVFFKSPEEIEAERIFVSLFQQIEFIGGPTKGRTAGGGRRIIRKGHESS